MKSKEKRRNDVDAQTNGPTSSVNVSGVLQLDQSFILCLARYFPHCGQTCVQSGRLWRGGTDRWCRCGTVGSTKSPPCTHTVSKRTAVASFARFQRSPMEVIPCLLPDACLSNEGTHKRGVAKRLFIGSMDLYLNVCKSREWTWAWNSLHSRGGGNSKVVVAQVKYDKKKKSKTIREYLCYHVVLTAGW